jgi:hypothetical protein
MPCFIIHQCIILSIHDKLPVFISQSFFKTPGFTTRCKSKTTIANSSIVIYLGFADSYLVCGRTGSVAIGAIEDLDDSTPDREVIGCHAALVATSVIAPASIVSPCIEASGVVRRVSMPASDVSPALRLEA